MIKTESHEKGRDRRHEPRYPWNRFVRFRTKGGSFSIARSSDLSVHGLRLILTDQEEMLTPGSQCQVIYDDTPLGPSWVDATVRYRTEVEHGFCAGLQLDFPSCAERIPFQEFVTKVAEQTQETA
jgi:hypothetical protein